MYDVKKEDALYINDAPSYSLKNDNGVKIKANRARFVTPERAESHYGWGVNGMCKFYHNKCENGLANVDCCKEPGHFKCFNKGFVSADKWEVLVLGCDAKVQASIIAHIKKFKEQLSKGEIDKNRYSEIVNLIEDALQFGNIYEEPDNDEREVYEKLGIANLIDDASTMEISVIKKDNKHGHESYGWGGGNKIILFNVCESGSNTINIDDLEEALKIANLLCDAMNMEKT